MRELAVVIQNEDEKVSPIDTINAVKKAGFENVFIQWYDDKEWQYSQEEQLKKCKDLGLNVIFAHLGYQNINAIWNKGEEGDKLVERYKRNIKECKDNGISLVVMHLVGGKIAPNYSDVGLNRIREITEYAKSLDVKVAFENTKIKGCLEYVLGNIKDENVGVCFDSGHYHVHFNDEFDFEFFKDRIFALHLHDNDKSDDLHLLPFDGTLDFEKVIHKLKESGYNGPVTLELCYRYQYLNMPVDDFYKEGYKRGIHLLELFNKTEENININRGNTNNILWLPLGMAIGMSLGVAFGTAIKSISLGSCIGLAIGSAFGLVMMLLNNKNNKKK